MEKRVIKFRGFSTERNQWVYGNLIEKDDPRKAEPTLWCSLIQDRALTVDVVVDRSVGQFTGLHDKSGREIYEFDIVKYTMPGPESFLDTEYIEEVVFNYGSFDVDGAPLYVVNEICEVIGNSFQHPELISQKVNS
jgi:uncharacterized phage protein (TIGR01671 family)